MKKLVLLVLALTLAGCSAFQPVPTFTPYPTPVPPTPQIVYATVLVTVIPTQPPTDTPAPTDTPTIVLLPVESPTPEATQTASAPGEVEAPAAMLGPVFSRLAFSVGRFSLRCEPKSITLTAIASDEHIRLVEFYYRVRAKNSTYIPGWTRGGTLETEDHIRYWLEYNAADVVPDNRKVDGWFEVEFVGVNDLAQVVGRSETVAELVTYTLDCP